MLGVTSYGDLSQFAQQQSRASAFILSIDDEEFTPGPELDPAVLNLRKFIEEMRFKNAEIPIYLYGETRTSRHIPNDILRELHGFIHMFEDTPEFVARHIIREAKSYLDGAGAAVLPGAGRLRAGRLVFVALPGPLGRRGVPEEPGRPDVPPVLRREHAARRRLQRGRRTRPAARPHRPGGGSERNAARIFNADHCFFVTNGTSTSNKMVWHHTVAPGDVVVVDRNCHKSILHAIIMTGAIPVFLTPTRNHFGIIGPIPLRSSSRRTSSKKIDANPFAREAKNKKPRILTLTQSTYDGVLYNVETHQGHARRLASTRCTSTRPGCRTRPSTSSTRTCTRSARTARAARRRWSSRRSRRTSCWPASRRRRRSWCRTRENAQARPPPLQRGLPDAHVDLAAVRDHRVAATWRRR